MAKKNESAFHLLNKVDVSEYTKKKGKFSYLSWCFAVQELLRVRPNATWDVHLFSNGENGELQPYMRTETGYFVQVTVQVDSVKRTQVHPVLDNRNQSIKEPNAFEINTSIQRCLAKAIALHGLGLYIFAGEDLPEPDAITAKEKDNLVDLVNQLSKIDTDDAKKWSSEISKALQEDKVNTNNYEICVSKCTKIIKENKSE